MNSRKLPLHLYLILLFAAGIFCCPAESLFAQKRKTPPRRPAAAGPRVVTGVAKKPPPADASPELERRLAAFRLVWETIKNNYFDQTFGGLDWDAVRGEYEPRVRQTKTDRQLHDILQQMIGRLNRSHFAVIPPEVQQAIEKAKAEVKAKEEAEDAADGGTPESDEADGGEEKKDTLFGDDYSSKYGIGVEVRLIDDRFVISRVEKGSAAEYAGLKTGHVVEKINGVALADLLAKLEIYFPYVRNLRKHLPNQIADWFLNGEKDSAVSIAYLDEADRSKEVAIRRERLKGSMITVSPSLPEQLLRFETAELGENAGYVRFNFFALPVIEKFCAAIGKYKDKKALVIDLRGNSGGVLGSMVGLGGMLTDRSIDLGTSVYKIGSESLTAYSKAKNYKGRLVLLVDEQTYSAAEVFAAALQENGRAVVVGEKTAGEALPALTIALPTGAQLLYPIANYKTRRGNYLEGQGVRPDRVVGLSRRSLLEGRDDQLAAALKLIEEDKSWPSPAAAETAAGPFLSGPPPPPPPPQPAKPRGKTLATVTVKAPPPAAERQPPPFRDEKSLRLIADFLARIGGAEALGKVNSYALEGDAEVNLKGSRAEFEFGGYRERPGRYAEVLRSAAVGEIKQVYDGKKAFLQTDYGAGGEFAGAFDPAAVEIYAPINNLLAPEYFKSLNYQGIFDRAGRKTHVIGGRTKDGAAVALAFDVETKLLIGYVSFLGDVSLADYRPVGSVLLPFEIERRRDLKVKLREVKLNTALPSGVFSKKESCFDRPD